MHAFVEILKLQFALVFGPNLSNAMRALNPFLLKGVAAGSTFVWLLRAMGQNPLVDVDPQPPLQVYEGHGAEAQGG